MCKISTLFFFSIWSQLLGQHDALIDQKPALQCCLGISHKCLLIDPELLETLTAEFIHFYCLTDLLMDRFLQQSDTGYHFTKYLQYFGKLKCTNLPCISFENRLTVNIQTRAQSFYGDSIDCIRKCSLLTLCKKLNISPKNVLQHLLSLFQVL